MDSLSILIRSSINIIQIVSYETMRIEGEVSRTAAELKRDWYKWGIDSGLKRMSNNGKSFTKIEDKEDALFILDWYQSDEAKDSILILQEYDLFLKDNPRLISKIRDIAYSDYNDRTLILLQTKRAWSASGCPGRPGLPDSQSRPGGVAGGWKSVLRFYSSSARKAVYPSYS